MSKRPAHPPKPHSEEYRPEITYLPALSRARRWIRRLLHGLAWILVHLLARPQVTGLQNFPMEGSALVTVNHLGDADAILALACFPRRVDFLGKAELYKYPVLGIIMRAYGTIWVHRGLPDRRALRVAMQALRSGRIVGLAPEGRESLTGELEEGTEGAAYLALTARVPILPVTFTGTANRQIFAHWKRLKRPPVSMTIGPPFELDLPDIRHERLHSATQSIMLHLARQLPVEYQGFYRQAVAGYDQVKGTEDANLI